MPANVVVVRKEMIKPSSPTPHHLKELKLSFLDQMAPIIYIPLIFFYEGNQKYSCQLLKNSLSKALTHYYPLAGRTTDANCYIDCNDAGALFIEAKVLDVDFLQFIENPDYMDDMKQLLHLHPVGSNIGDEVILAVQINLFGCGGIAIAVQMCHKIADGNSIVNFMYAWAAICRGDVEIMNPSFDSASFFPPIDLSTMLDMKPTMTFSKEKIVTKHLLFDKKKLEILKAAASSANGISHCPTRVEVISAIIWKELMEVTKHKIGNNAKLALVHAVNLRPRMHPSLPDCAFGNFISHTVAMTMKNTEGVINGYHSLLCNLRVAIKSIDEDFVKKVQKRDEYMDEFELFVESISKGEIEPCYISSWCRFPVYEVDYGWGKPVWVSSATVPYKNSALFLTTKNGDGIEVWFHMLEEDASVFESDVSNLISRP